MSLPSVAEPIVVAFSIAFTEPTFQRVLVLTVDGFSRRDGVQSRVLWTMGELAEGHFGFETPRQRVANSVPRMAPCLLGLFSLVSLIL